MDAMETKMAEWRKRMPSKRALTSQLGQFVQQKSVAVMYTQSEQDRIKNVTDLIALATNEFEKGDHWDRMLKVVDVLGNTSNKHVLKEGIRYVRLRLGDPSARVVLLTLTLAEALMKNCNRYVHKEIGSEAFMAEMEALYKVHSCKRGRDSMEIEGRVLELIQTWGEAFMNQKFEYPYFIYTYEKLRKKKGVNFPKYDKTKAPLFNAGGSTRRATSSSSASSSSSSSSLPHASTKISASVAKLSSKEVYHVATNVAEMFEDMIHEAEQDTSSIADRGVIVELAAQAQELLMRLQGVIQAAADSDSEELGKYLAVNDTLHTALTKYDDLKKNGGNQKKHNNHTKPTAKTSATGGFLTNNQLDADDDDDGFGDFVRARVGGDVKPSAVANGNNQTDDQDDDPFASFASQRATKSNSSASAAPAAAAPAKDLIDLWDDEPAQPQSSSTAPVGAPPPRVTDLWGSDDLLQSSAPGPVAMAAPQLQQNASPFDDLWGDLVTPASAPVLMPTPVAPVFASANNNQNANPFDFFEDFSAKATISAPIASSQAAPAQKANPFDFGFPPPSSQTQAPKPVQPAAAALNPFDF